MESKEYESRDPASSVPQDASQPGGCSLGHGKRGATGRRCSPSTEENGAFVSKNPAFIFAPPKPTPDYVVRGWIRRLTYLGFKDIEAKQASQFIFTATEFGNFLDRVCLVALGRKPQLDELRHWLGLLESRKITRTQLADLILTGEEASRHIEKIKQIGLNKLARLPVAPPSRSAIKPEAIQIPLSKKPLASVIIPVYGKVEYTLQCLDSIGNNPSKTEFEVLVIDDCSPDDSFAELEKVRGIRLIKNEQNLGFVRTCNYGASLAKGDFLHFLNNDTTVSPGWLDELVKTFDNFENTAIAGSKLVYPDGRLQEAGAIVWQDASAWNYGNGKDPEAPEYNYARIADYVSGASLMVTRAFFESVSGFDERYAPAYCEDSDLCFQARDKGYMVVYQPLSRVVHCEGVSSGTDLTSGTKAYQVVNMKKFKYRWGNVLKCHRPNGRDPHLERDRAAKGRVLFIDACTPTPDQDSGSIDIYNLMKAFVGMGWAVSFIPEDNYAHMEKYTPMMQAMGVQMLYYPYIKTVDEHISVFGATYDLVMSFRPMVTAKHIDNLRLKCPNAKVVFNTVDLHFLRLEREAALKKDRAILKESEKLKKLEVELIQKADLTTVVSSAELRLLQRMGLKKVVHLPFSREIRPSKVPFEKRSGILFVGGFQHQPNADAVQYFVNDIMPLLREMVSGLKFHIVGSRTPLEIQDLACEDILVHGLLEDLESLMDTMRLNVAPLRYGAGTKGKVIHALANGLPTVATPIAVEGMGLVNLVHVGIADNANDFAKTVCEVYSDKSVWGRLSHNGICFADQFYGIGALRRNLNNSILAIL